MYVENPNLEVTFPRRLRRLALGLAVLLYGWLLVANTSFVAGGSDSSGYLNSARQLARGAIVTRPRGLDRLRLEDRHSVLFSPLGYVHGPRPGTHSPYYPPGMPLHMAVAGTAFGWQHAPFLVSPLAALLGLAVIYLLGRELGLSPAPAVAGSAVLAAWPAYNFIAIQPMSDVLAALWTMVAILGALRSRRGRTGSVVCGAALGLSVAVRPTSLLAVPAVMIALPRRRSAWLGALAGAAPFALGLGIYNHLAYGSALAFGYAGHIGADLAWSNFPPRFAHYGYWLFATLSPLIVGGWIVLPWLRRTPRRHRILLWTWFLPFLVFYSFYRHYEPWWYLRFLVPAAPALILAAALAARRFTAASSSDRRRLAVAVAVVAVVALCVVQNRRLSVFSYDDWEEQYRQAAVLARQMLPERSVVAAMQMTGALEYFTDLVYVRYDRLSPPRLRALEAATHELGYGWYALLFPFEVEPLAEHVPGGWHEIARHRDVVLLERASPPPAVISQGAPAAVDGGQ